jgi:hypothetical protein
MRFPVVLLGCLLASLASGTNVGGNITNLWRAGVGPDSPVVQEGQNPVTPGLGLLSGTNKRIFASDYLATG